MTARNFEATPCSILVAGLGICAAVFGCQIASNPPASESTTTELRSDVGAPAENRATADPIPSLPRIKAFPRIRERATATLAGLERRDRRYILASYRFFRTVRACDERIAKATQSVSSDPSTLEALRHAVADSQRDFELAVNDVADNAGLPQLAFSEFDQKAMLCAKSHRSAYEEMMNYWVDEDASHLANGAAVLNRAVDETVDCLMTLEATIDELQSR